MEQKIPVQVMNMDLSDRVELVPGHVYRKSIGAEALGVTMFWIKKPSDPEKAKSIMGPGHRHGEEMFFVLKGRGTMFIEGKNVPIKEGDTVLIPAGVLHGDGEWESDELVLLAVENPPRPGLRFYFNDVTKQ